MKKLIFVALLLILPLSSGRAQTGTKLDSVWVEHCFRTSAFSGTSTITKPPPGSNPACDTARIYPPLPPPTVTSVTVTPESVAVDTGGTATFVAKATWSDGLNHGTAFLSFGGAGGMTIIDSVSGQFIYKAGPTPGVFQVGAIAGEKSDTSYVTVKTPPLTGCKVSTSPAYTLCAPINAMISSQTDSTKIKVSWTNNANTTGATSLELQRSNSATGSFATVATLSPTATSSIRSGIASGVTYCYRIRARFDKSGFTSAVSAWSAPIPCYTAGQGPVGAAAVDSVLLSPTAAVFDTLNPIGVTYTLSGIIEKAKIGRSAVGAATWAGLQFCTFVRDSATKTWGRVPNDTNVVRCNSLFAVIPLLPKKVAAVIPNTKQIRVFFDSVGMEGGTFAVIPKVSLIR